MKILLVSNEYIKSGRIGNPIIYRLQDALRQNHNVESVEFVPFKNSFKSFYDIRNASKNADVIHIQFGGLYAFLIWICLCGIKKPKLLTFHGTDIHAKAIKTTKSSLGKVKIWMNQKASFLSILLFEKLGFVSDTLIPYIPKWIYNKRRNKLFIQPLGVDYNLFVPTKKVEALKNLGLENNNYILFSDISGTAIKRRDLAEKIVEEIAQGYKLLIMCKIKQSLVPMYINACDFIILTSDEEGSPNITREALALNKRVFSVDVGDVKQQLEGLKNSGIVSRDPKEAAKQIKSILAIPYIDNTRESLRYKIEFAKIGDKLVSMYSDLINK